MSDIYANPVGKISKEIYIIKNDINEKVYIGQSIKAEDRFKSHCKRNNDNSLIDIAIQKYGKEHFWYELLEEKTENYNEREQYWIKYYNSLTPNGYNILPGGQEPPYHKGEDHPSTKLTRAIVDNIKSDLKYTTISLRDLAKKYNISKRQIIRINQGISWEEIKESYPIRKNPNINGKLTEDDVNDIIYLLKYSYRFNGDIARQYGVEVHTINRINKGEIHKRENESYPIRKWKSSGVILFTYEQVTDIIERLLYTKESISSIAKEYGVTFNAISQINQGTSKKYKRDNLLYPLRPY